MTKFKFLFLITNIIILITFLIVFFLPEIRKYTNKKETNVLPAATDKSVNNYYEVSLDLIQTNLVAYVYEIESESNISLINNLTDKLTSQQALRDYNCKALSSSYFYTTEEEPLGYLEINQNIIEPYNHRSTLINGVFALSAADTALIMPNIDDSSYKFAFQTGPIIKFNNESSLETLDSDVEARRILAATDADNNLYIIALARSDLQFLGPNLSQLPEVLSIIEGNLNISFTDVINFDGGNHSAFYVEEAIILPELSFVGGFLCFE